MCPVSRQSALRGRPVCAGPASPPRAWARRSPKLTGGPCLPLSRLRESTPARFGVVVFAAFGLAALLYMVVITCGYLTFGDASRGLLLLNYAATDPGAQGMRLATVISVLAGYPLTFLALRDSTAALVKALFQRSAAAPPATSLTSGRRSSPEATAGSGLAAMACSRVPLSLGLLALCTLTTVWAKDVAMIIALRGALVSQPRGIAAASWRTHPYPSTHGLFIDLASHTRPAQFGSVVLYAYPALVFLRSERGRQGGRGISFHRGMVCYGLLASLLSTAACIRQIVRAAPA